MQPFSKVASVLEEREIRGRGRESERERERERMP
jgi:hypothetical protein